MRCAVPDQFDLRGPADGFHRSADRAGGYARAGSAGAASWASRAPRIAGDVVADSTLTSCRADATARAWKPCSWSAVAV